MLKIFVNLGTALCTFVDPNGTRFQVNKTRLQPLASHAGSWAGNPEDSCTALSVSCLNDEAVSVQNAIQNMLSSEMCAEMDVDTLAAGRAVTDLCQQIPELSGQEGYIRYMGKTWPPLVLTEQEFGLVW